MKKPHILALYGLVTIALGAVAGLICWAFFFLMDLGIEFIWHDLPLALGIDTTLSLEGLSMWWWPLPVCLIGGVLIGLLQRRYKALPEDMHAVMGKVKKTNRYEYNKLGGSFLCALAPLLFGGSVGPEAGLVGVIAGMCTWVGDRLRFLGKEFQELASAGVAAIAAAVFNAPLYGLAVPTMDDGESVADMEPLVPRRIKIIVYVIAVASALGAIMALNSVAGGGGGLPRFTGMDAGRYEWLLILPMALAGAIVGWICLMSGKLANIASEKLGDKPFVKAIMASLLLGLVGCVLPLTMFAGEAQAETLREVWMGMGVGALLLTALLKPVVLQFCVSFGWRGGIFFPMIFSGISCGYAMAAITGADPVFCLCATTAAAMGATMRQPIMAVLLLFLCFPVQGVLPMLVGAVVGSLIPAPKMSGVEE